jgi:hypothetical protein
MSSFDQDEVTLPSAFAALDLAAQKKRLRDAHARLEDLEAQLLGLRISALFEQMPELTRLMFLVDWDYDNCMDVQFCSNLGSSSGVSEKDAKRMGWDPETDDGSTRFERCERLRALVEQEDETDAWTSFGSVELRRPASGPVAPVILQALLSPENFARWQASDLNQSCALSPDSAAPRRPSAL